MSLIEFDVWLPPVDLTASPDARLSTDDSLTDAGFNPVFLGEGDGFLELHADDSDTQYLQRRGFVRAVRTDTEEAIFDFWLEEADVKILAKKSSDRTIRWSGRGSLYVLDRYRLGQAVYAPDQPNRGSISVIDYWTWLNISPGGIMTRVYEEGFHHPESFYAAATIDFDRVIDSAGLAWTDLTDYQTRIGTSGLQVAADMMRMGLMVRTLPGANSILIQAFRDLTFTTDRTSGTFAANKVRFEAGINIAVELPQKIAALQERTHTLTRRQDGQYATETNEGSGEPYMDFMEVPYTSDPDAVEAAVATNHLNRRKQSLVAVVQHRIGAGGASGAAGYFPSPDGHYWPGDLVTVHTGTGEYDLNEQALQVAGIRYFLRGADWMVQAQLGAQVLTATGAPIAIGGSGPTVPSVPIHFCEPDVEGSEPTLLHSWEFASTGLCSEHGAHEVFNGGLGTGLGGGILNNGVAATGSINGSPSMFPMTAGTSYIIAGRIREYDDDGHTGPAILRIRWRLSDGSEAGNDDVASVSAGWTEDSITVTAPTGTTQAYWEVYRPAAGVHHLLSVDWVRIYADDADTGVERDGPVELVGTSIKAARCDHNHLLESLLTEETDTTLVPHPDGAGGVEWGAGTAAALDDLSDVTITAPAEDDMLRYVSGEWINDNRRWEAVTDGADVFVWEGDDLVHEWKAY